MPDRVEAMRLELRRGVIALAVLRVLEQEHYGYSLRKLLLEAGLDIEEGTLYPLVRRLESHGLLRSRWTVAEGRRRRYYQLSGEGRAVVADLRQEWQVLNGAIACIEENM